MKGINKEKNIILITQRTRNRGEDQQYQSGTLTKHMKQSAGMTEQERIKKMTQI